MKDIKIDLGNGIYLKGFSSDDVKYYLYREYRWEVSKSTMGSQQWYLGEFSENEIDYVLEQVKKGLVRCNECGEWIPVEEAFHFIPAGCYCEKHKEIGRKEEKEYWSYGD